MSSTMNGHLSCYHDTLTWHWIPTTPLKYWEAFFVIILFIISAWRGKCILQFSLTYGRRHSFCPSFFSPEHLLPEIISLEKIVKKFSFNGRWWHQFSCLALQSCWRTQIVHLQLTLRRLFSTSLDGGLDGGLPRFALTTVWMLVAIVGEFSTWQSYKHCK